MISSIVIMIIICTQLDGFKHCYLTLMILFDNNNP